MFCSKCGSELVEGSKFCNYCGEKIVLKERKTNDDVNNNSLISKEEDDICENKIRRDENNVSTDYFYLFNGIEITGLLFAILSIFLPFVKVGLLGISRTITLLEGDGIIIAGISVVVIIFLVIKKCLFGVIGSFLLSILNGYEIVSYIRLKNESGGLAELEVGFYLLVIGSVLVILGMVLYCCNRNKIDFIYYNGIGKKEISIIAGLIIAYVCTIVACFNGGTNGKENINLFDSNNNEVAENNSFQDISTEKENEISLEMMKYDDNSAESRKYKEECKNVNGYSNEDLTNDLMDNPTFMEKIEMTVAYGSSLAKENESWIKGYYLNEYGELKYPVILSFDLRLEAQRGDIITVYGENWGPPTDTKDTGLRGVPIVMVKYVDKGDKLNGEIGKSVEEGQNNFDDRNKDYINQILRDTDSITPNEKSGRYTAANVNPSTTMSIIIYSSPELGEENGYIEIDGNGNYYNIWEVDDNLYSCDFGENEMLIGFFYNGQMDLCIDVWINGERFDMYEMSEWYNGG